MLPHRCHELPPSKCRFCAKEVERREAIEKQGNELARCVCHATVAGGPSVSAPWSTDAGPLSSGLV